MGTPFSPLKKYKNTSGVAGEAWRRRDQRIPPTSAPRRSGIDCARGGFGGSAGDIRGFQAAGDRITHYRQPGSPLPFPVPGGMLGREAAVPPPALGKVCSGAGKLFGRSLRGKGAGTPPTSFPGQVLPPRLPFPHLILPTCSPKTKAHVPPPVGFAVVLCLRLFPCAGVKHLGTVGFLLFSFCEVLVCLWVFWLFSFFFLGGVGGGVGCRVFITQLGVLGNLKCVTLLPQHMV